MNDWTSGYVADIGYTFGYYQELNPLRARLAFLAAGLAPPSLGVHCELGFGQGVSVNVHAAASASSWYGTDFNPSQAAFAQELARASEAAAHLFDEAFAEFCARDDLPSFDSIGLHGIWSWISDENRAVIADFVRRKLKVGGVLYVSYNTQPGWAAMVPMRDLLTEHAEVMAAPGRGIISRIDAALEFADKLFAANPIFARSNPLIEERVKKLKEHNRSYLAHEYFNRDWLPMPFSRLAQWLEPTKLNYACSANYLDHIDSINLSPEQQALLKDIPDPMFRQTVRDFCVNQQFRKDYWVKGARFLPSLMQAEAIRAERVVLTKPRSDVSLKATGSLGEATLQDSIYNPMLDVLADYQPKSLGEIEAATGGRVNLAQLLQGALILAGTGVLQPAQSPTNIAAARKSCERINATLVQKARGSGDMSTLASPVTGGGIAVDRFQQLFLISRAQGKKTPGEWAQDCWQLLSSQGQHLIKEGKRLTTAEENLAELEAQARSFADKTLPVLEALLVV